eukprot:2130085-Prymnesium_polylepis.1
MREEGLAEQRDHVATGRGRPLGAPLARRLGRGAAGRLARERHATVRGEAPAREQLRHHRPERSVVADDKALERH